MVVLPTCRLIALDIPTPSCLLVQTITQHRCVPACEAVTRGVWSTLGSTFVALQQLNHYTQRFTLVSCISSWFRSLLAVFHATCSHGLNRLYPHLTSYANRRLPACARMRKGASHMPPWTWCTLSRYATAARAPQSSQKVSRN
eukprot:448394-Amphidinium_carterae.1